MALNTTVYPIQDGGENLQKPYRWTVQMLQTGNTPGLPIDPTIYQKALPNNPLANPIGINMFGVAAKRADNPMEFIDNIDDIFYQRAQADAFFPAEDIANMNVMCEAPTFGTTWRNTYNNLMRWYSDKTSVNSQYYQYYPYTRINPNCACLGVRITAMKFIDPDSMILEEDYETETEPRTFHDYASYMAERENYPVIIGIDVYMYLARNVGSDTRTTWTMGFCGDIDTSTGAFGRSIDLDNGEFVIDTSDSTGGGVDPDYATVHTIGGGSHYFSGGVWWIGENQISIHYEYYGLQGVGAYNIRRFYCGVKMTLAGEILIQKQPCLILSFSGNIETLPNAIVTCYGFPFARTTSAVQSGNIRNNNDIYVPTLDSDGNINGSTNVPEEKDPYLNRNSTADPNFDPVNQDPNTPTNDTPLDQPKLTTTNVFNKSFAMTAVQLRGLSNYLWNQNETTFETIIKGLGLMGTNPINAIISVFLYPFEIPTASPLTEITVGTINTHVYGTPIASDTNLIFDLGSAIYWEKFHNFLDYEPYTSAYLYVPYCGIFKISNKEFLGKTISVKMVVDVMTGSGTAIVFANGIAMLYKNCKVGAQIGVTGENAATIAGNYISAIEGGLNTAIGAGQSAAIGNEVGAITTAASGLTSFAQSLYTAENVPIDSKGSNSPSCGAYLPQYCYLITERPEVIEVSDYGRLVGYACCKSGAVGTFSGYCVFDNIKLDITNATESEKSEIINLLKGGVYV